MSEQLYDIEIAPKLEEIATICKENKLPFLALCEFEPETVGATYAIPEFDSGKLSLHMLLPLLASFAKGNIDSFLIEVMKYCNKHSIDTSQSMFLHRYSKQETAKS